jgi:hypothetical protein
VIPSGLVAAVAFTETDTAQNNPSSALQQTEFQDWELDKVLDVQVIPLGLVAATVPPLATAQNNVNSGLQQTDCQDALDGSVLEVQVIPSGLVAAIVPVVLETVQNNVNSALQHTELQALVLGSVLDVQVLVRIVSHVQEVPLELR